MGWGGVGWGGVGWGGVGWGGVGWGGVGWGWGVVCFGLKGVGFTREQFWDATFVDTPLRDISKVEAEEHKADKQGGEQAESNKRHLHIFPQVSLAVRGGVTLGRVHMNSQSEGGRCSLHTFWEVVLKANNFRRKQGPFCPDFPRLETDIPRWCSRARKGVCYLVGFWL